MPTILLRKRYYVALLQGRARAQHHDVPIVWRVRRDFPQEPDGSPSDHPRPVHRRRWPLHPLPAGPAAARSAAGADQVSANEVGWALDHGAPEEMLEARTRIVSDRSVGAAFFGNYYLMDYELMGGDGRAAIIDETKKRGMTPFRRRRWHSARINGRR